MKNKFTKILLSISTILFVIFSLGFVFFYKKINDNNQKAEAGMVTWTKEESRRDDIRALDRSLQKIAVDRTSLDIHFAKSSDVVPFLDTIEKLAPQAGATALIDSVNTGVDTPVLIVGLTATGSFEALYKFLTLLENSPYELDFLSMDIHRTDVAVVPVKNAKGGKWQAVFKMQLLSFTP